MTPAVDVKVRKKKESRERCLACYGKDHIDSEVKHSLSTKPSLCRSMTEYDQLRLAVLASYFQKDKKSLFFIWHASLFCLYANLPVVCNAFARSRKTTYTCISVHLQFSFLCHPLNSIFVKGQDYKNSKGEGEVVD